ncbi:MAG: hypothetical protein NZ556_00525 [Fimbriimonadales bacterium]|nr:hypothetical protein [Fimbriimonadales bacterium]
MYDTQSRRRRHVWTGAGTNPLFSPDRRYLILNTSDGVQVIDVQTKRSHKSWAKRVLSENFSPRNELVVETDSARRFVVAWDALKRSQPPSSGQTPAPLSGILGEAASLAWSADGQWIAYIVIPNTDREELWLMHTKRADKRLVHKASGIGNLRWSDDSQELFFVEVESVANKSASVRWMKYRIAGKRCIEVKW